MILNSNTEATENKVEFLNYAYTVKGFQYHSNNSLQLFELKEKQQQNNTHYLNVCSVIFFSYNNGCKAQCFDTTGHTPTLTFAVSLVDNAFSSKYCCVWLITMPKSALTYNRGRPPN